MKWTYDWLKDYLKTSATCDEIAAMLTRIGLEIDGVTTTISPIAARIEKCDPVPDSDHLHILMVNDGTPTPRQVVCGAPNARVGLVSALALPGCVIQGHEIKSGKLRGIVSNGMMCSGAEIGINDDNSGILELAPDTPIGTPILDAPTVFDAGITPNRPDYLAVRGIARDLAAAGIGEFIAPHDVEPVDVKTSRRVNVMTDKCNVYRFCEISGIKNGNSNKQIAARLTAIGINPKNAPIDATNYICFDMAQPMHCFDADQIHGDITVRMANDGESFTDLFGETHKLISSDIVIADDTGVLALAGVIGGARGATGDKTKNIILESAYFDPVCVRKTSKRLGISTDASYRYERGIDPTITGYAMMRAADIIMGACGGKITGTGIGGANKYTAPQIKFTPDMFVKKTGIKISSDEMTAILSKLGYTISGHGEKWTLTPPSSRVDVQIPETVIADLIRIYGYEKIATQNKHTTGEVVVHNDFETNIKRRLAARGLNEAKSFGFGNSAVEELLTDNPIIKVANPITADFDTARNSLLGNMLIAVAGNIKRGYPDMNMFELGTVFDGDIPSAQHTQIVIARTGAISPRHWMGRGRNADIYDVKADLVSLLCGQRFSVSTDNVPKWAHPYRYGAIYQGKRKIAEFGELHPAVAKKLHIKTNTVIGIVDDITNLAQGWRPHNVKLSEFQPITRDFAFVVDKNVPAEKIVGAAQSANSLISDVIVFDAFDMGDGTKSIGFSVTITPNTNMSDSDLQKIQSDVIGAVEKKCNARIRDK